MGSDSFLGVLVILSIWGIFWGSGKIQKKMPLV